MQLAGRLRRGLRRGVRCLVTARSAVYSAHGPPKDVVRIETVELDSGGLKPHQALIRFMASPINPADINQVEGVYPIRPDLPATAGNEGVAKVVAIGAGDHTIRKGSWVIPLSPGSGTWRTHSIVDSASLIAVPDDIPVEAAAMMSVNPATALRMLRDFSALRPGDVVIQNAANSAVGQCVIQIAKAMQLVTVNIIRDRDDFDALSTRLTSLGAGLVVAESVAGSRDFPDILRALPSRPVLALNAVGGPSATNLARALAPNGVMVTYGGMSRKPVTVPTGLLIFDDIVLRGFWLSRWTGKASLVERQKMINELVALIRDENLTIDVEKVPFGEFERAIDRATQGKRSGKVLLEFE